jgi:hypothetical protein
VARAKRTDRAEARRRSRAALAEQGADLDHDLDAGDADSDPGTSAPARAGASRSRGPATPTAAPVRERPSIIAAFRGAFRPVDWRSDIRALPSLLRHWSFYVPVILSGLAVVLTQYAPKDPFATTLTVYFAGVPPIGSVFIAGLFTRRASWLVGALVSLAAAIFLAISLYVRYAGLPDGTFVDVGVGEVRLLATEVVKGGLNSVILDALTTGVITGALFASAGAWYRRFLKLANPNRARPTTPTSRRPDGKIPRKPAQRPMLARRR